VAGLARDLARFALLYLRKGRWQDRQIVPAHWVEESAQAYSHDDELGLGYGYMWWTLKGDTQWEGVPSHVYYAAGFGGNYIVVDDENDLVVVLRWTDGARLGEIMARIYEAL
jgi:CubicO group peptidase (beta-lactamase class C family)